MACIINCIDPLLNHIIHMKAIQQFLIIIISTTLFLVFFSGLYFCYEVYYSSYFSTGKYDWFIFSTGGKIPSESEILLSGFKSLTNWVFCILISLPFYFIVKYFMEKWFIKSGWLNTIIKSCILTLLLAIIYFSYLFLYYIINNSYKINYSLSLIKDQFLLFNILYFIQSSLMVSVLKNNLLLWRKNEA